MNGAGLREYFVYRCFNTAGELLYVGCTKRLSQRWSEHRTQRPVMTDQTARCRLQGPYTREVALRIEKEAIRAEEPLHGWSPLKHREKCARSKWIDQRTIELTKNGVDVHIAIRRAVVEAEEWFPDPYVHTYSDERVELAEHA